MPGGDGAPGEAPDGEPGDDAASDASPGEAPDDGKTERAIIGVDLARGYDYSCVMAMLDGDASAVVREFARNLIDASDLSGDGFEDEPHITLRYGLHTESASDVAPVLHPWVRFSARVLGVSLFSTDEYDVVKLDVTGHDGDLHDVHELLGELEHTDTYGEFKPHITLAYVKPGMGAKYADARFPFWSGKGDEESWLKFNSVRFSSKDGTQTDINLRDGHEKAVARALAQWERKSLTRLKSGQGAACAFESEVLSDELCGDVRELLAVATDKALVREVFAQAKNFNPG